MADKINEYKPMKNEVMIKLFEDIITLKEERNELDKQLKELDAKWKPMAEDQDDMYFELPSGSKISIIHSERKGNIDTKRLEKAGINVEEFRKEPTKVTTLRISKDK